MVFRSAIPPLFESSVRADGESDSATPAGRARPHADARWPTAAFALVLIGVLGTLIALAHGVDVSIRPEAANALHALQRADAQMHARPQQSGDARPDAERALAGFIGAMPPDPALDDIARSWRTQADALATDPSASTGAALDALHTALLDEHRHRHAMHLTFELALQCYSLMLLIGLGIAGRRMQQDHALLRRAHARLVQALHDRRAAEEHLIQTEKLSAMGQMLAGIAHEISTPLAYVKGLLDVIDERMTRFWAMTEQTRELMRLMRERAPAAAVAEQFGRVEQDVGEVVDGALLGEVIELSRSGHEGLDRIREIITDLRDLSRMDPSRSTRVELRETLRSTLVLAGSLRNGDVRVECEIDDVAPVIGSPSQLGQVFLNLVTNALHAMQGQDHDAMLTVRAFQESPAEVCVEVQDNGAGVAPEALSRIFEPFFTTKPAGQGTGMGLAISQRIVQAHRGRIDVDSEPGAGTLFRVTLPAAPEPGPQQRATPVPNDDPLDLVDPDAPDLAPPRRTERKQQS